MILDAYTLPPASPLPPENLPVTLARQGVDRVILCAGPACPGEPGPLAQVAHALPGTDFLPIAVAMIRLRERFLRSAEAPGDDTGRVIELAGKNPACAQRFQRYNPALPGAYTQLIEAHRHLPLRGLELHQAANGFHFSGLALHQAADIARGLRLPVLVHLRTRESAREFAAFSQMHTEVQFIVAHLFGMEWFAETPSEFPNLNFEISPLALVSDLRIQRAVRIFGAQRVIFGSGAPIGSPAQKDAILRVQRLPIPGPEKRMILGENMAALLS